MREFAVLPLVALVRRKGEDWVREHLSEFSCPINKEVEDFIRNKAVQSARLSASATYLVYDGCTRSLLGYFTLMMKSYSVLGSALNSTNRRLLKRYAEPDDNGVYNAAVYLIAQLGKNFNVSVGDGIAGDELLNLALNKLSQARSVISGKLVMVERESDRTKLLDFYRRNGFRSWTSRYYAKKGITYDQMFTVLTDEIE